MGRKYTQQEAEQIFKKYGYELLEKYTGSFDGLLCFKDGYKFYARLVDLQSNKKPSLWSMYNQRNVEDNLRHYMQVNQAQSWLISCKIIQKNQKRRYLCTIKCKCGCEFDRLLESVVYKNAFYCLDCSKQIRGSKRRKGDTSLLDYIASKGYLVIDKRKNFLTNQYIEVEDVDGYKGFVKVNKLSRGSKMSKFDMRVNKLHYIENVNTYCKHHGFNVECLDFADKDYTRQALRFRCGCGNEFVTSIASFQNGKARCDVCAKSISRYEEKFKSFLEANAISYIYQYTLNQCRDVLPLPFDFYIKDYNVLVEIDGEGHYHPCNFNQISNEKALLSYQTTIYHDRIKSEYCKQNNLKLLRIPYYAMQDNSYQNIFFQFIKG